MQRSIQVLARDARALDSKLAQHARSTICMYSVRVTMVVLVQVPCASHTFILYAHTVFMRGVDRDHGNSTLACGIHSYIHTYVHTYIHTEVREGSLFLHFFFKRQKRLQ